MFEYIKGRLIELNPASAIIETAGVAYFIEISLNTYSIINGKGGEDCKLFLHHIVREDAEMLFGFSGKKEREVFRLLISVS